MTYESMQEDIKYFIEEELDDMRVYPDCYLKEEIVDNTRFLSSLDKSDMEKISNMILEDDELGNVLNNTIRYYVYHYKKEVK